MKSLYFSRSFFVLFIILLLAGVGCRKTDAPVETPPSSDTITTEADITNRGHLSVSIENYDGANGPEGSPKLVDGDTTTKFLIYPFAPGFYMQLRFDTAQPVAAYTLTSGNDADGRDPLNWTITASNDSINWVILDQRMGALFRKRRQTRRFDFKNTTPYKYYRWNVTALYYEDMFQASEWRVFQVPSADQAIKPVSYIDSLRQNGLSLYFINHSPDATPVYKEKMIQTFFTNYPKLLTDFNPDAIKKVHFIIDPSYNGVAYTIGSVIVFSYDYMKDHPKDIDVVTHEIMHLIQAYPGGIASGWLSEGIADYVRYKYGLDNAGAGWSLPDFNSNQSYTDSYRVTARFLAWIELHVKKGFVKSIDAAIRNKTYTAAFWADQTGKTVDALWAQYAANPAL